MRLQDQVTLVTGGAAGIGKATAEAFAREGAKVVICDLNAEAGQALLPKLGPQAAYYAVDVTDRRAIQAWVDAVVEKYGRIDVLVNNAGYAVRGAVEETSVEQIQQMFDVNVFGVMRVIQAVAPHMRQQRA